ncbi:MAG: hypothetical protein P4L93_01650 [Coriobacteriia bacterium]|nr:hypothetical protein [Coriobacteriia bacterium]
MSNEIPTWTVLDEPSAEEFEAAEEELAKPSARSIVFRFLKLVVALLLVAALVVYFATPFINVFGSAPYRWLHRNSGIQTIPVAPAPKSNPKLPA